MRGSERTTSGNAPATRQPPPPRPVPNVSESSMRRKLTVQSVYGRLDPMRQGDATRWYGNWYCYITGAKEEQSQFGPYIRWLGDFKHEDLQTGEVTQSNTLILPGIASDRISAAYSGGANIGGAAQNVMLAFQLGTDFDMNKAGYKFTLREIRAPSSRSPLDLFIADCYQQPALEDHSDEHPDAESEAQEAAQ